MSHIFDALLKSEGGPNGKPDGSPASVTDILKQAERRAAAQWKPGAAPRSTSGTPTGDAVGVAAPGLATSLHAEEVFPPAAEQWRRPAATLILEEHPEPAPAGFKTIDPLLPANCKLVCYLDKGSAPAEAFRLLAVRLRHIRRDRQLNKLLITSTVAQEGKSLTSANLACSLSDGWSQKVLLVEGDIRRPSLTQLFGLSAEPGLCEFLQGHIDGERCIYHLAGPNFWLLPAGKLPGNPLDLIQSPKLPELLEHMKTLFDWVIIDSPPVLPMADTSILARMADGILLVSRRGVSEKKHLQRGLDALEKSKLLGCVINSSRKPQHDYYYYGAQGTDSKVASD
ncbi:MAG TPA: CpsD/CapB family tyrosine-protein kinase [Candidatus Sulfotelmatobacter sp.]|nr:CpsD/CapB family tyrosine-protein kinase [Candidatus Sulfotelmatobacter sp.]